jgi:hypothetical protein
VISDAELNGKLDAMPGTVWQIPPADGEGQNAMAGEFSATELDNYLKAVEQLASAVGAITRTPKHYYFAQNGTPSGEALIAMEAPLNKKPQDRIDRFTPVWRKVGAFLCQLLGIAVDESQLTPVFDRPETTLPVTNATITKTRVESGVPLRNALAWEGKSDEEIALVESAKQEEQKQQSASLAAALVERQKQFNSGNV